MSFLKRKSRGSFQPICTETRVPAYYLGKHQAKGKVGLSVVQPPVATLYSQFREVSAKRVLLEIKNDGLWIKHTGEGPGGRLVRRHTVEKGSNLANRSNNNIVTLPVSDIAFGAVDTQHRKVFAVIVRKTDEGAAKNLWECHAFLCNTHSDAKHMTLNLVAAFQKNAQSTDGAAPDPTTIHVFTESLSPKYQRGASSKGSVMTLKLTFNVEQIDTAWTEPSEYNRNKDISKILSERDSPKFTKTDSETGEGLSNQPSSNSDKENEGSDSDPLDVSHSSKSRTSLVAVNTGLTQLTVVHDQEEGSGSDEDPATEAPSVVQEPSPKQSRTRQKPKKKKMVRFTAEIDYIDN